MLAIDTNVLVRLLVRDDAKQTALADQFVAKGAWVSHLVLAETLWALDAVYERKSAQLIAALDLLLAHESLVLQDADTVSAALADFRSKPTLGFSDCLVLAIAKKAGHVPLGTFDRDLARLEGAHRII
jgi:predicted nucleic-acid-binding protein